MVIHFGFAFIAGCKDRITQLNENPSKPPHPQGFARKKHELVISKSIHSNARNWNDFDKPDKDTIISLNQIKTL